MDETQSPVELDTTPEEVSQKEPSLTVEEQTLFDEMMEVGVFYGRSKSRTNPLMKEYVVSTRSGFEVLDLHKTIKSLKNAAEVLYETIKKGGLVMLVGTSPAAKGPIKELGEKLELPYVSERWLGGTITNFKTISKRIAYFKKLKEDKEKGKLDKYTKKEQLKIDRELAKLEKFFAGIESLERLPDVLFIADLSENEYAAKEAKIRRIPTVAVLNSDGDSDLVDYPIPANDRSTKSISLILDYFERAMTEAKETVASNAEEKPSAEGATPASRQRSAPEGKEKKEETSPTSQTGFSEAGKDDGE